MTGLEKVTGKIIADAEADARAIHAKAEGDADAHRAAVAERTEAELDRIQEAAERECESLVTRAKSSAVMAKRNVILETRSSLVDEAYARAEQEIRDMPVDTYFELLTVMLKGALRRQLEGEQESLRLYGENIAPERYEIVLNGRDRRMHGDNLLNTARNAICPRVGISDPSRVVLSTDNADIGGGLILRCGDVEANCSLTMLFSQVRRSTEQKVADTLFAPLV